MSSTMYGWEHAKVSLDIIQKQKWLLQSMKKLKVWSKIPVLISLFFLFMKTLIIKYGLEQMAMDY